MKSGGKVLIQALIVSLIGLAGVVGILLLLSQGASADADISVSKTANPISLPVPGGDVTFTVRVDNESGTETVTLTSLVDNPGSVNLNGQGTCAVTKTIVAGGYYECFFTGTVSSTVAGYVIDVVTAVAVGDGDPADIVTKTATATVSITAGPLDRIVIEDEADGAGEVVYTRTMTTDDEFIVYAAGYDAYNNYIADQVVGWATTGTLDSQTGNGISFTFAPTTANRSGTITADAGGTISDTTGTITVSAGALDYIRICTDTNGQSEAGDHTMTTDNTWTLWAAGYDEENNFRGNETAAWDETGSLDPVSGSGTSYTFSPLTAGTSGTITASVDGKFDATGTITVTAGALHRIEICRDANGQHSAGDHPMTTDATWPLWAAGYDEENNFRGNETAAWDETGSLDPVSGSGTSYTFSPLTAGTSGTITASVDGKFDATGTITVTAGALHRIEICRDANGQHSAGDHPMTTDATWPLWAAGYDEENNFRGNETAAWDETGSLDPVSGSGTSYTFSPSTAGTSGTITASVDGKFDATGVITVTVGALDYIVIEDAAGGTGNEVDTHSLVTGETFQVWAAGYDADDNYRSDVTVTWSGTGVVMGRLSPASGTGTTFTAGQAGTGTIKANDGNEHEDETWLITVQTPVLTIAKSDNPDPVNAGATLAYTIIITNSGDANGTAIIVTEYYDPNFLFQGAWPRADGYPTSNRTWTIDTLEVSASQTIIVWGNVASPLPVGTVLTNRVTLDSDQTAPVTITEGTSVTTASELTVAKFDIPDPVPAGGDLTYIISYQNGGTATAGDVVITEEYDSQVTFVSANPAPRIGTDNVWDIGDLAVGEGGSIQVTVRVNTPLPDGDILTNRVTIDSTHTSPLTYVEATGVSAPDLAVLAAAHEPSLFSPDKLMNYTVAYSNTGSLGAKDVVITTTLPPDTTYAGQGWTSSNGQTYTYEVGDLSAGAGGQAYFTVRYADQPQIGAVEFNTPFIISESGIQGDANLDNNTAYVYIGVPDLVVADFTVEPSPLHPGQPVTFTVVVKNQGTGVAWNPDNGSGFFVDVFIASVSSYPFERDGVCWKDVLGIGPGLQRTVVITHSGFKEEDIGEGIERFYVRVDNHSFYLYGLVPEYDEMNNLFTPSWSYYAYLPLVFR